MNPTLRDASLDVTPSLNRSTLTAVFVNRAAAMHAIDDLQAFGLRDDQISLAMRNPDLQDRLIADTGTRATVGAAGGTRPTGGLRGLVSGLRAMLWPGRPQLAAAPASSHGAALVGGMVGAMVEMQMPEAEARRRESAFANGSVLVTAKVFEDVAEAKRILQQYGGEFVARAE